MKNKSYIKLIPYSSRPVQIEPCFFKYLNGEQIKVLHAIIFCNQYGMKSDYPLPFNHIIAFFCGFDLKSKNKDLTAEIEKIEKIIKQLTRFGIVKKEIIDDEEYLSVDYEWNEEKYLDDFEQYFNNKTIEEINEDKILRELEELTKLIGSGRISKRSLIDRLEELSNKLGIKE